PTTLFRSSILPMVSDSTRLLMTASAPCGPLLSAAENQTADPCGGRPLEYQIKRIGAKQPFGLLLDRQDLATAIHAGLEVDVMRTTQLARILVFDIGGVGDRVGRAAEAALHRRGLAFWHSHNRYSENQNRCAAESGQRRVSVRIGGLYRARLAAWLGASRRAEGKFAPAERI